MTWINLENIMLCEINQSQKTNTYDSTYEIPRVVKFVEAENRIVGARAGKNRKWEII